MKKFFWCLFHLWGNYKVSPDLDKLIYRCIYLLDHCKNVSIEIDFSYIEITTSSSSIKLWNCNKFYAWLNMGNVNGRSFISLGSSASAKYDFKECLKRHGYDIYMKSKTKTIKIDDVKC